MSALEVGVLGFVIAVAVVLVVLWCCPGLLGAARPPRWRGWKWDGDE